MSRSKKKRSNKIITVIISTYNNEKEIRDLMYSVQSQKVWQNGYNPEFIFIDNNSTDKTVTKIKKQIRKKEFFLNCTIIENSKNKGFAGAVNQGIKISSGELILLLNPDLILINDSTLCNLVICLQKSRAEIVGGLMLRDKGKVSDLSAEFVHGSFVRKAGILAAIFEFTNVKKLLPNNPISKHFYYLDEKKPFESKFVDAVSGAFMLFKKNIIDTTGYFDERFFLYLEDVDFCLRAKSMNYKIFFCNKAVAYHFGGASSKYKKGKINYTAWKSSRKHFFMKYCNGRAFNLLNLLFYLDDCVVRFHNFINKRK